jgi:hypothetical protein
MRTKSTKDGEVLKFITTTAATTTTTTTTTTKTYKYLCFRFID